MHNVVRTTASVLIGTTLALAAVSQAEEQHHQHSHTHGQAQLQVAIDRDSAELILRSPAANLLGFEHEPRNEQQEATLEEVRQWVSETALVHGPENDCRVTASTLHHQPGDGDHDSHSDFEITQQLTCNRPLAETLETPLPKRFPGIERLSVEWVSNEGQGHGELRAGESRISLGR